MRNCGNMKNKRWWMIAAAALLLGGGIWHASQHRSTGPAEGVKICGMEFLPDTANHNHSTSADDARFHSIRVGSFNLHGCKGLDGRVDVERAAKCLENLDFAALEEVHGPGFFGGEDQASLLGKQLKMAWLFTPAVREWYCLESGTGFLTSLPVTSWQRIPLQSHIDYSFRNVVFLVVKQINHTGRERSINILVTHVNRRYDEDRQAQLRAVLALFRSLEPPVVLLGDLNSDSQDPQIKQIIHDSEITEAIGKILGPRDDPQRIDWIFCRGLICKDAGIKKNDASDHPMVWAELE